MTAIPITIRTGYPLSYVPFRGHRCRTELVSEIVPVMVEVVDALAPAILFHDDGNEHPVTWVHEGALYQHVFASSEPVTLAAAEQIMSCPEGRLAGKKHWGIRHELDYLKLPTSDIYEAPLRDDLRFRQIYADDRQDGLRYADAISKHLLIHDGNLFERIHAPVHINAITGRNRIGLLEGQFETHPSFTHDLDQDITLQSRALRTDDLVGRRDWWNRNSHGFMTEAEAGFTHGYHWTEAGLAAEDMLSWWTLWCAARIYRQSQSHPARDRSPDIAEALDKLGTLSNTGYFLPTASSAATLAEDVGNHIEAMAGMIETASAGRNLLAACQYVLYERSFDADLNAIASMP